MLTAQHSQNIHQRLQQITKSLENASSSDTISLFAGESGKALYFAYLYQHTQNEGYLEEAFQILGDVMDTLGQVQASSTLCDGFTGVGWLIQHLATTGLLDLEGNAILEELDGYIAQAMETYLEDADYDLLHGYIGQGIYFLERLPFSPQAQQPLEKIIQALQATAIRTTQGITWQSLAGKRYQEYDLGLSHGVPSIIGFLVRVYQQGIMPVEVKSLITESIHWLLAQQKELNYSVFPGSLYEEGVDEPLEDSRLAWCYGDLGIALVVLQAGVVFGNEDWMTAGQDIALKTCNRTMEQSQVNKKDEMIDAGFCHGVAGIAYLFYRLYTLTQEEKLQTEALRWINLLLDGAIQANLTQTNSGYLTGVYEELVDQRVWKEQTGLLEGIAGIGLVLLSLENPSITQWDKILLTNTLKPKASSQSVQVQEMYK